MKGRGGQGRGGAQRSEKRAKLPFFSIPFKKNLAGFLFFFSPTFHFRFSDFSWLKKWICCLGNWLEDFVCGGISADEVFERTLSAVMEASLSARAYVQSDPVE